MAAWTGIPVAKMMQGEMEKLVDLEEVLKGRVIGQDEAVGVVAGAIRRNRAGLSDPNRPIGSFLFLGPTGVGKTELAKTLAEYLFDSEKAMVRIDMSEYMEKFSVQRLIGAPPGYVGYDEGGQLTEAVRRNPYCVVLLDEMEKAHPDVFNILLQVLDDGRLTDGQGRVVNFKNCIIIMTSNVGSQIIREHAAEGRAYDEAQATGGETMGEMAEKMMSMTPEQAAKRMQEFTNKIQDALSTTFRPEFLNRIDDVITFNELSISAIEPIVDLQLEQVRDRLQARHITLDVTPAAMEHLAIDGYDPVYGARPLKRLIQREVVDRIAEKVISGELRDRSHVLIDLDAEGNYACRVEGPMDLDGLNLDDPSFLTAGCRSEGDVAGSGYPEQRRPRRGSHRLVKGGATSPLRAPVSGIIARTPAPLFSFGSGAAPSCFHGATWGRGWTAFRGLGQRHRKLARYSTAYLFHSKRPGQPRPGALFGHEGPSVRVDSDIVTAVTMKASVLRSWGLALTTAIRAYPGAPRANECPVSDKYCVPGSARCGRRR